MSQPAAVALAAPTTPAGVMVDHLTVTCRTQTQAFDAVRDVSFSVAPGHTLALVGESGAGKSLTARSMLGLLPRGCFVRGGSVTVGGVDIGRAPHHVLRGLRGGPIGLIPQDPMTALNPVRKVGAMVREVVRRHSRMPPHQAVDRVVEIFSQVGLPRQTVDRYPHQLSGGMRQRVLIAMALVNGPRLIVADEPTTALDATVQAQILDLISQRIAGTVSLLLVTHDLSVAAAVCERIAVMYGGRIVEEGPANEIVERPRHPYTAGLLEAVPSFAADQPGLVPIPGTPLASGEQPAGCAFRPRCGRALPHCAEEPKLEGGGHRVACWSPLEQVET